MAAITNQIFHATENAIHIIDINIIAFIKAIKQTIMNRKLIIILITIVYSCNSNTEIDNLQSPESNYKPGELKWKGEWIKRDTSNLKYPCTLDSIILTFFHTWDDSVTFWFKNIQDTALVYYNHSTGMWLRNSHGLWSRTCLVEYFWEKGIFHPDDISAIILTSYHRYLNGKEIKLEEQIEMFLSYWKNEFGIIYKLEDSASWDFPPSMWDFGMSEYVKKEE